MYFLVLFSILSFLTSLVFGVSYDVTNGETEPEIPVLILNSTGNPATGLTITDLDLYYRESGETVNTKIDLTALTGLDADYSANKAYEIGQGWYRVDFPTDACDTGVHKQTVFWVISGTNLGLGMLQLSPPTDVVTSGGNPNIQLSDIEDADYSDAIFPLSEIANAVSQSMNYIVPPPAGSQVIRGTVLGHASSGLNVTSVTLDNNATGDNDAYAGMYVTFRTPARPPITSVIVTYTQATKIATIFPYVGSIFITDSITTYELSEAITVGTEIGGGSSSEAILTGRVRDASYTSIQLADSIGVNTCDDGTIDSDGGKVRITKASTFTANLVDSWAYCDFSATYTDGSYTILSSTVNSITIDLTYSVDTPTVDAWVNPSPNPQPDIYNDNLIIITSGLGEGQTRAIWNYFGHMTGVDAGMDNYCQVDRAWDVIPDTTSTYKIIPSGVNWLNPTATTVLSMIVERGFWSMIYSFEDTARTSTTTTIYITHTTGSNASVDGDFIPGTKLAFMGILGYSRPVYGVVEKMGIDDAGHCIVSLANALPSAPQDGTLIYPLGNVMNQYWKDQIGSAISH